MTLNFRFAIVSDPHIALPHTVWDHPSRFHLVEVSIPALENALSQLEQFDLDFLLLPGDLTQHGEPENHAWLAERLRKLPYPAYVIPGNHDMPAQFATPQSIGLQEFPTYYTKLGYDTSCQPYYSHEILPGVRLIGLNSIAFNAEGNQYSNGSIDEEQLDWLGQTLATSRNELVLVMIHHNVIEHLPGQSINPLGRRYMLDNASTLLNLLQAAGVQLLFTGHLHVQDIAYAQGIYEITTGSLVSYPHPYRILEFCQNGTQQQLRIESGRVTAIPGWSNLPQISREWMGDRSFPFMVKLLTLPPLNLPLPEAEALAPSLRYFWAEIANGDAHFSFPHFPPEVREYIQQFSAIDSEGNRQFVDNSVLLDLHDRL